MRARNWVLLLFLIPFVAVLWPPFYASVQPQVLGIPFFTWYQLAWAVISAVLTVIVYLVREPGETPVEEDR